MLPSSFRGRLLLLISVVAVPAVLLSGVLLYQGYHEQRTAVGEKLSHTARAAARVVDGEIRTAVAILDTLTGSRALAAEDFDAFDLVARNALRGKAAWFILSTLDGTQRINTAKERGSELPQWEFEADAQPILRSGRPYVSNLRTSPATNRFAVQVSRMVQANATTYVMSLVIPAEALAQSFNVEDFQPGGVISVVDRNGRIITRNKGADKFVGKLATPDMVAAVTAGRVGVLDSVTLEGIPVLTAVGRADCGWSILIGAPQAELFASARTLFAWALAGTALVIGATVLMTVWLGRAMVRSVNIVTAGAESIARGQLPPEKSPGVDEMDLVDRALRRTGSALLHRTRTLETLNKVSAGLVAERDLEKIVQSVTDAGRHTTGAAFGAFFYNVTNAAGESYMLYTLSGAPREAFEKFGMPRNTAVFAPTFGGEEGVVRVADITKDPRYGKSAPHHGMPKGHLPVRSYLAASVKGRDGTVIGGLFFGHPEPNVFTAEAEEIVAGLAAEAAIAVENANLYRALQSELAAKTAAERDLRAAQDRLQEHAENLEQTVKTRTESLRQAVEQMEEFSYTVSHDLRSPIRAMNSFAQILLDEYGTKLDDAGRGYLERIIRASDRMQRLTTDLLVYSRVVRAEVRLERTDLESLVEANVESYPELHAPTQVLVERPLLPVLAHPPSLSQSIGNLLTNAAKFVRTGESARITVRTEKRGDRVRLWIEDEGIGIPISVQPTLFKVFQRGTAERHYEGTGIGLAIVRKSVEKMGGACGVESDGVKGSRFWIELSVALTASSADSRAHSAVLA